MAGLEMIAFHNLNPPPSRPRPATSFRPPTSSTPHATTPVTTYNVTNPNTLRHATHDARSPGAMSSTSATSSNPKSPQQQNISAAATAPAADYATHPLTKRHGRSYLRDPTIPYPLPCDLPEIHRQSLRSLMLMRVFGSPFCAPYFEDEPPKRVLEMACGSALWSSASHDYFARDGFKDVAFTGLDIISMAPDLKKQGIDWLFVQHDVRKSPLPFPDGFFDFIFVKDTGLCPSAANLQADPLRESLRILKSGGVLEVWDSDYIFRTLLPNPPAAPGISEDDQEQADMTGTYTVSAATPFAKAQNSYLQDYNTWAQKAFDRRKLTGIPCAFIGLAFSAETDSFRNVGSRRIAIPLGEVRWEREGIGGRAIDPRTHARKKSASSDTGEGSPEGRKQVERKALTTDQLALRRTALLTIIQMIESLEPMLMDVSGKSRDEWDRWWASMTTDLLQQKGAASGECLEVGAWWGQKL